MKTIFNIVLLLITSNLIAQDILYKKDNSKQEVKILSIEQSILKYKPFQFQDGPVYVIAKSDVALIVYQNGTHEAFNIEPTLVEVPVYKNRYVDRDSFARAKAEAKYKKVTANNSVVFVNMLEFLNSGIGVSYL